VLPTDNSISTAANLQIRQYVKCFLNFLSTSLTTIRIALVTYDATPVIQFSFNDFPNIWDILTFIDQLPTGTSALSDYYAAVNAISQLNTLRRANVAGWILFIADRTPSSSQSSDQIVALTNQVAAAGRYTVQTMGLSNSCPNNVLLQMASLSKLSTSGIRLYDCESYDVPNTVAQQIFFKEREWP
jgi:hypothetical protein